MRIQILTSKSPPHPQIPRPQIPPPATALPQYLKNKSVPGLRQLKPDAPPQSHPLHHTPPPPNITLKSQKMGPVIRQLFPVEQLPLPTRISLPQIRPIPHPESHQPMLIHNPRPLDHPIKMARTIRKGVEKYNCRGGFGVGLW